MKLPRLEKDSTWINKGKVLSVEEIRNNRLDFARPDKLESVKWFQDVFPETVNRILSGECLTYEEFEKLGYYKYLVDKLHPSANNNGVPTFHGRKRVYNLFFDLIRLCRDVKENGIKSPLDMFLHKGKAILIRGGRRLEILYQLGVKEVPVRFWRNKWLGERFVPSNAWAKMDKGIHANAVKQFMKYKEKSTDKYWIHNYTPYYDNHIGDRKNERLKILEIGVKDGMSLKLWRDTFRRSEIFGIDLKLKMKSKNRITVIQGDERDLKFLDDFGKKYGLFDMIVDDALHRPDPQRDTFNTLWKYVNKNGLYVCEDLHPNYRLKNSAMPTFMDKIHNIWTDHTVKGVSFYPNICFIRKA